MTKEEFSTIFSRKIEELETQRKRAVAKYNYHSKIWRASDEVREAENEIALIDRELEYLRGLIHIPAYERIMAMSEAEINAYKEEKKSEIDSRLKVLISERDNKKKELALLKADEDRYIDEIYLQEENERRQAQYMEKARVTTYEIYHIEDEIDNIEKELRELIGRKEEIENTTPEKIKEDMVSNLTEEFTEKRFLEHELLMPDEITSKTRLLASVDGNKEKTDALIKAILDLDDTRKYSEPKRSIYLPLKHSPKNLREKIQDQIYYKKDTDTVLGIEDLDKILELTGSYKEKLLKEKELIDNEFTIEKMAPIYDDRIIKERNENLDVDLDYLRLHIDKISEEKLNVLISLIDEKTELEKKIFKTKKVKAEIESINERIRIGRDKLYDLILSWYETKRHTYLIETNGYRYVNSSPKHNIEYYIHDLNESSEEALKSVDTTENEIKDTKAEKEEEMQRYVQSVKTAKAKILDIVGPEFKEEDIPYITGSELYTLGNTIKLAAFRVKLNEEKKEVKEEAKKQADQKEAEIKGVTLEELMELKKKAEEAKAQIVPQDNNPGTMTM